MTWGDGIAEGMHFWEKGHYRGMLTITTSRGHSAPGVISPRAIAKGKGDQWLLRMNRALGQWGDPVYINLMAEMNGYWNDYSAFEADGSSRGDHSTADFKQAWRRITLILRGGKVASINRELRKLHLRTISRNRSPYGKRLPRRIPRAKVAMMWVPMWKGSPNNAANSPDAYWPGPKWVDWVGTDMFSRWEHIPALDLIYRSYAKRYDKPMVIAEYAPWSDTIKAEDDPEFVKHIHRWARDRSLARMLIYYQAFGAGDWNPFKLINLPKTRTMLRDLLGSSRYEPLLAGKHTGKHAGGRGKGGSGGKHAGGRGKGGSGGKHAGGRGNGSR